MGRCRMLAPEDLRREWRAAKGPPVGYIEWLEREVLTARGGLDLALRTVHDVVTERQAEILKSIEADIGEPEHWLWELPDPEDYVDALKSENERLREEVERLEEDIHFAIDGVL